MPLLATLGNAADQAYGFATYAKDQFFNLVTTLISGSGTNAATNNTFVDSSANNFSVTRFNNVAQGTNTPFSRLYNYWSAYFGGVGNYCSYAGTPLATTTATFTVESWIYMTATPGANPTLVGDMQPIGASLWWSFGPNSARRVVFLWNDGASKSAVGATVMDLNRWYHIAVSVNANAITMYVNGVAESLTGTTTLTNRGGTTSTVALGQAQSSAFFFIGYAYNISILSGTAKYSGAFTPQIAPLATNTTDQVFLYNGGISLRDANTATTAKALTQTGSFMRALPVSVQQNGYAYTTFNNGGSMFFNGSTGNYVSVAGNSNLAFGTGDFTIECFVYMQTLVGFIYDSRTGGSQLTPCIFISGTTIIYYVGGANRIISATVAINQWYHLVVSRVSGNTRMFLNGVQTGSTYVDSTNYINNTNRPFVGVNGDATSSFYSGYISNLRVLKGTGTTAPTVPTAPLTAIPDTQLLLSASNSGIFDASAMTNIETAGSSQVSNAVIQYGNGSVLFNGTTSFLNLSNYLAATKSLVPVIGDFTIEAWVYPSTFASTRTVFYINGNATGFAGVRLDTSAAGIPTCYISTSGSAWAITLASATAITVATWSHIAIVRSGASITFYLNGISVGTSSAISAATALLTGTTTTVGALNAGSPSQYFSGYMSNLRVTQVARYTANFTPPTGAFPVQG